jgi:hypothetical protein
MQTDYKNALEIYGEDLGVIKGKTVKKKQGHVHIETEARVNGRKNNIILAIDLIFFTGLLFLITVCRNIRFVTATLLPNRKMMMIMSALNQVLNIYTTRGHIVKEMEFQEGETPIHTILADNEFQALRDDVEELGIKLNVISKDEHVPEVECQNRVIEERARAIVQTLRYK